MTASDLERPLSAVGLRVARPRTAVLSAVHDHPHADTDSILGVVHRSQPTGSLARYEARVGDNHHRAVCRSCGASADVDCAVGATPCLVASNEAGSAIDEAEVIYWGHCPQCRTEPVRPAEIRRVLS